MFLIKVIASQHSMIQCDKSGSVVKAGEKDGDNSTQLFQTKMREKGFDLVVKLLKGKVKINSLGAGVKVRRFFFNE